MKTMSKILTAAFMLLLANQSFAQAEASADGTATATIIAPITITAARNLQFGYVAVSASTPGTVELPLSGPRVPGGGVTLPNTTGTVTTAQFNVTGDGDRTFLVTLPSTAAELIHESNTSQKMTVTGFVCTYANLIGTLSSGGAATFYVGGTLNVNQAQLPGNYSGTFEVIVDYN